jgi:hypothetical protein
LKVVRRRDFCHLRSSRAANCEYRSCVAQAPLVRVRLTVGLKNIGKDIKLKYFASEMLCIISCSLGITAP